jgi:mRNA interferase YafQ
MQIRSTKQFERDMKRIAKRGKNIDKLQAVVDMLQNNTILPPRYRLHALKGEWIPALECHIEPDWLLAFEVRADHIMLVRTGSHSDLFG